ncbi:DUF402 domain-containing protein [Corynebacterium sp. H128]|uniref:DUF402 domain-containing protein n=1 Tax=unclassified Corynebacterium TaxID=2624378 RepID=UPI0030B6896E
MTELHPVKQETFDVPANTNIDPKGFLREVDTYLETEFGLYMARGANHPEFGYLESWLLPSLSVRVNKFHYRPGYERNQDFYIDVAAITVSDEKWHTRDYYVDLISVTGEPVEVVDIDELAAATSAGIITADEAEKAIETTLSAVDGITRAGDDAMGWLTARGIELSWAPSVTLLPAS